jgi:hypothetical protein
LVGRRRFVPTTERTNPATPLKNLGARGIRLAIGLGRHRMWESRTMPGWDLEIVVKAHYKLAASVAEHRVAITSP